MRRSLIIIAVTFIGVIITIFYPGIGMTLFPVGVVASLIFIFIGTRRKSLKKMNKSTTARVIGIRPTGLYMGMGRGSRYNINHANSQFELTYEFYTDTGMFVTRKECLFPRDMDMSHFTECFGSSMGIFMPGQRRKAHSFQFDIKKINRKMPLMILMQK